MCKVRCKWVNLNNPLYVKYHDTEWGVPKYDDNSLFMALTLEGFQAGLSFECVLNKSEDFYKAYEGFDIIKVAAFTEEKVDAMMNNSKLIRHRNKINASIENAKAVLGLQKEYGSFSNFIWSFTDFKTIYEQNRSFSPLSEKISDILKKRGMKYVGKTIIYSFLQAVGVINSHSEECFLYRKDTKMG